MSIQSACKLAHEHALAGCILLASRTHIGITVLQLVALDEGMQGLSGIQVRVDVYSISMQACG